MRVILVIYKGLG